MKAVSFQVVSIHLLRLFMALAFVCGQAITVQAEDPAAAPAAAAEAVAGDVAAPKKPVLAKSASVYAMPTKIMDKAMVQDVVRVGERLFLAGERGHIGWSDDGGKSWQQAKVPTIADINALYFVTQELGWAVGHDGNIFNTVDGGKTWAMQLDGIEYNLKRAQAKADRYAGQLASKQQELEKMQAELDAAQASGKKKTDKLEAAIDELSEAVDELDFQVRDAHKILEEENAPWPLMDVWFSDVNVGYAVGAFNAFLMTTDGGKTWQDASMRLNNPDGLHLNIVGGLGSTVLIGGEGGLLFRSRDAGATWEKLESPDDGSFYAINVAPTDQPGVLNVLIVGLEGAVYRSANTGTTWDAIEHDMKNNLNGIYTDANGLILLVGNDGAMLRSLDNGKTFEAQHRFDQVTMSSVTVNAAGDYVLAGATGIKILKPADWASLAKAPH